ncbi:MAG: SAM-dependent methyltransferase, partial [Puniceicoccales bacterium]
GRSWEELLTMRPAGTARAYYRHEVSDELLAQPGEQDLTCHVCWDRIEGVIQSLGAKPVLQRQESFFVLNAETEIAKIISGMPSHFDPQRQSLMELLHPQHMGARFQAIHAVKQG